MGAIRRQPWEFQDQIALRSVMTLSVSFDHRLVDGAEAARFLADVGAILARPGVGPQHGLAPRRTRRPRTNSSVAADEFGVAGRTSSARADRRQRDRVTVGTAAGVVRRRRVG